MNVKLVLCIFCTFILQSTSTEDEKLEEEEEKPSLTPTQEFVAMYRSLQQIESELHFLRVQEELAAFMDAHVLMVTMLTDKINPVFNRWKDDYRKLFRKQPIQAKRCFRAGKKIILEATTFVYNYHFGNCSKNFTDKMEDAFMLVTDAFTEATNLRISLNLIPEKCELTKPHQIALTVHSSVPMRRNPILWRPVTPRLSLNPPTINGTDECIRREVLSRNLLFSYVKNLVFNIKQDLFSDSTAALRYFEDCLKKSDTRIIDTYTLAAKNKVESCMETVAKITSDETDSHEDL